MAGNNSAAGGDGGRERSWRVQQIRPPWLYRKDKVSVRWASKLQAHSFSHYQYYDTTAPRACGGSGEGFQKQGWILPCPQSTGGTKLLLQVLDECAKVFWLSLCRQLLCLLTDIQKKVFLYKVNRTVFLDGLWGQVYCFCYRPGTAALAENWAVLGSTPVGRGVSTQPGQWENEWLHVEEDSEAVDNFTCCGLTVSVIFLTPYSYTPYPVNKKWRIWMTFKPAVKPSTHIKTAHISSGAVTVVPWLI